jgi:hypothetical protein
LEVALGNTHNIHCIVIHFTHVVIQAARADDSFLGHEFFDDGHDKDLIDHVPVKQ